MARQDPELQAIATIGKALDKLKTPEQRRRVIAFVSARAEPIDWSLRQQTQSPVAYYGQASNSGQQIG